jgi:uncharacterized protein YfdQ (DUF2303 family)
MDSILNDLIGSLHAAAEVKHPDADGKGVPFVLVPEGYTVEDVEGMLPKPVITRRAVRLLDSSSFIRYVNNFKLENTILFANDQETGGPTVKGVIDYPSKNQAEHGAHTVTFAPTLSEQWKRWTALSGKPQSQAAMAAFLEENIIDVVEPVAADLMEVCLSMEATMKGAFRSGVRLHNGNVQLTYSETTEASAGDGRLVIPEKIVLGIPVFEHDDAYRVEAWLRYRINEGKLLLIIELHRKKFILDDAFAHFVSKIETETSLPVLFGTTA